MGKAEVIQETKSRKTFYFERVFDLVDKEEQIQTQRRYARQMKNGQ